MANRRKTERNQKILDYWAKGYRQISIAKMFKLNVSAVGMVIWRANNRSEIERLKK